MTLDVYLKGNSNGVPSSLHINGEPTELIWGFKHQGPVMSNGSLDTITEIEVIYRSIETKAVYLLKPSSIEELKKGVIINLKEDDRHVLFGSRELYLAFLEALNEDIKDDKIPEGAYVSILKTVNGLFLEMHSAVIRRPFLGWLAEMYFKRRLMNDTLVQLYIEKTRARLKEST